MLQQPVIRYIVANALIGKLAGWTLVAFVLVLDVAALWSFKAMTDVTGLAAFMLMFVAGTTLGMIQMGIAIMALGAKEQKSGLGAVLSRLAFGAKPV